MPSMRSRLGLQSLVVLALIAGACAEDPSGTDEADSGSDTSSDGSTGDETASETASDTGTDDGATCDQPALEACWTTADEAFMGCAAACPAALLSCVDAGCMATCESELVAANTSCQATHCPDAPDEVQICKQGCLQELSACLADAECDVHECQWDAGFCVPDCAGCTAEITLDYAYDGSCELPLPELVHPVLLPYFAIAVGDQSLEVADEGTPCDTAELGGTIEHPLQGDVLLLCPDACDAFTDAGALRVIVDGPCGA
jgi:hypothetical protein